MSFEGKRERRIPGRRTVARMGVLAVIYTTAALCDQYLQAQSSNAALPACDSSGSGASISIASAPANLILKPTSQTGNVLATGHLSVRNDGGTPLSHWCARTHLYDYTEAPQEAMVGLAGSQLSKNGACQDLVVPPGGIEDLTLTVQVNKRLLPYSGVVFIGAMGQGSQKESEPETQPAAGKRVQSGSTVPKTKMVPCLVSPKQISQVVVVTLADSASHAWCAVFATALLATIFLAICLVCFRRKLSLPMGASQWSFSSSAATNLTVVGSLLGTALASSALPDYPHYMTKQTYIVLGVLFGVLAALSPVLYNFFCKPFRQNPTNQDLIDFQGWVWLFLASGALTIWAVAGQLATLSLLFNEFAARQHIPEASVWVVWGVAGAIIVSLFFYCGRTALFYVASHPARTLVAGKVQLPPRWTAL